MRQRKSIDDFYRTAYDHILLESEYIPDTMQAVQHYRTCAYCESLMLIADAEITYRMLQLLKTRRRL